MKKLLSSLIVLLAGCGGSVPVQTSDETTVCRGQDQKPEEPLGFGRIGDTMTHQGFLYLSEADYEFRPCNKDEIYLVDASFAVIDVLDQFASTHSSNPVGPLFVRFHGNEIECTDRLPGRYANAVSITELVAKGSLPPAGCN
jgi:hypothetical protein